MRVAIVQFYTKNVPYGEFSEKINRKYCEENGYSYIVEKDDNKLRNWAEDRAFTWIKPKFILEILNKNEHDYILFLDIDAIISNNKIKIEEFVDEQYDIVAAEDCSTHSFMNAGVLLVKNTEWSKAFMRDWWEAGNYLREVDAKELGGKGEDPGYFKNALWHDQTCLTYLHKHSNRSSHIKIVSNRSLNWREYNEDNFIFHAYAYGNLPNRKLDMAYHDIFNIKIDTTKIDLLNLANFYQTDKESTHRYISNYYQKIMEPLRDKVTRFCEIGVDKLGSIKMWRDYFQNAEIIGCDIADIKLDREEERIKIFKMDQSIPEQLDNFCSTQEDFDIIIDDGSHKMYDQQITFAKLFKKLKPGGIYILEDIHTSTEARMPEKYIFNWGDPNKTTTLEMLENFIKNNKINSDYLSEVDEYYLENNIDTCEILKKDSDYFSVTSVIKKKTCT